MSNFNPYQTLKISPTASSGEIKQAYRRLVKLFHPDSQSETADHHQIILINAAYELLNDPQRRQVYDRQSREKSYEKPASNRGRNGSKKTRGSQADAHFHQWLKQVYLPINEILEQILTRLEDEIDDLSADPFDDELLEAFQRYLESCLESLKQVQSLFRSLPNPGNMAGVAADLYYCLNHVGDGIEELTLFTLNYDDHYLHTGQELFRMAAGLQQEAQFALRNFVN